MFVVKIHITHCSLLNKCHINQVSVFGISWYLLISDNNNNNNNNNRLKPIPQFTDTSDTNTFGVLQPIPNTDINTRNYLMTMVDDWYKGLFVGMHIVHVHWVMY